MPFTSLLEAEEQDCCYQHSGFGAHSQGRTKGQANRAAARGAFHIWIKSNHYEPRCSMRTDGRT